MFSLWSKRESALAHLNNLLTPLNNLFTYHVLLVVEEGKRLGVERERSVVEKELQQEKGIVKGFCVICHSHAIVCKIRVLVTVLRCPVSAYTVNVFMFSCFHVSVQVRY